MDFRRHSIPPELPRERASSDKVGHDASDDERLIRSSSLLAANGAVPAATALATDASASPVLLDDNAIHPDDVWVVQLG